MARVILYSTRFCPYCVAARQWFKERGIVFEDVAVDGDQAMRARLRDETGQRTVPQIWIGPTHVGGYSDLLALARSGRLDEVWAQAAAHSN